MTCDTYTTATSCGNVNSCNWCSTGDDGVGCCVAESSDPHHLCYCRGPDGGLTTMQIVWIVLGVVAFLAIFFGFFLWRRCCGPSDPNKVHFLVGGNLNRPVLQDEEENRNGAHHQNTTSAYPGQQQQQQPTGYGGTKEQPHQMPSGYSSAQV